MVTLVAVVAEVLVVSADVTGLVASIVRGGVTFFVGFDDKSKTRISIGPRCCLSFRNPNIWVWETVLSTTCVSQGNVRGKVPLPKD
jgi:hypothetical protein